MVHLPLQHQRFGFLHVPDQGVDRVVSETTQHLDAQMTVDDDVAMRLLGVGDHDDRLLLTVLAHRREKPAPTFAAASAQLGVGHVELVELQFHSGGSDAEIRGVAPSLRWAPSLERRRSRIAGRGR